MLENYIHLVSVGEGLLNSVTRMPQLMPHPPSLSLSYWILRGV